MATGSLPAAYCLRDPGAVCRCGAALEFDPAHPGSEDGDWYVHPGPGHRFGHTSAFMRAHAPGDGSVARSTPSRHAVQLADLFTLDTQETR